MKGTVLFMLILTLVPGLSSAQDFWQKTNGPDGGKILSMGYQYFLSSIFAATADSGLYRTEDFGENWIKTSLSDTLVTSILINSIGQIFAGTADSGVYRSIDYGNHWTHTNGLQCVKVTALAKNINGYIFAGANDGFMYRTVESTTAVEQTGQPIPSSFSLKENYPNPFNQETIMN